MAAKNIKTTQDPPLITWTCDECGHGGRIEPDGDGIAIGVCGHVEWFVAHGDEGGAGRIETLSDAAWGWA